MEGHYAQNPSMSVIEIFRQLRAINLVSGHSAFNPEQQEKPATA